MAEGAGDQIPQAGQVRRYCGGADAWRALPPCFKISKSTSHRRFVIWSRAGVWGQLHQAVLDKLAARDLLDLSRVVLDSAHVRAKKGGRTCGSVAVDRAKSGSKMHILALVGCSATRCFRSRTPDMGTAGSGRV